MKRKIIFVTGGIKSGKSSFAIKLSNSFRRKKKFFIATAEPFDKEMKEKIEKHKKERGSSFKLIEEPIYLSKAIENIQNLDNLCVIDCINIWLNNLIYYDKLEEIEKAINALEFSNSISIIVSNEINMGIIPENKLARNFINMLGEINKKIASLADEVYFMVSGIPVKIK